MALMICPECGKEVSDKANVCVHCGFPIQEHLQKLENDKITMEQYKCKVCGFQNNMGDDYCGNCGMRLTAYRTINKSREVSVSSTQSEVKEEFHGVYKYTLFGGKQEVYCPRCGSADCSHYKEQKVIPGKTKTKYTANLNPLHPFTLVNKKEKVVRKEQTYTENKFMCNSCGKVFY